MAAGWGRAGLHPGPQVRAATRTGRASVRGKQATAEAFRARLWRRFCARIAGAAHRGEGPAVDGAPRGVGGARGGRDVQLGRASRAGRWQRVPALRNTAQSSAEEILHRRGVCKAEGRAFAAGGGRARIPCWRRAAASCSQTWRAPAASAACASSCRYAAPAPSGTRQSAAGASGLGAGPRRRGSSGRGGSARARSSPP